LETAAIKDIAIIDVDTHVIEPYDLWTSRLASKWGDKTPQVKWDEAAQEDAWFLAGERLSAAAGSAMAGYSEYPPYHPRTLQEADPATWDATARLARMDDYGIEAQILYPNVGLFNAGRVMGLEDQELQLDVVKAYNDWQSDWSSVAPNRFIPVSSLPFWDLDATLAEITRCAEKGHRGVIFTQNPMHFGLPGLDERHWDPMWALCQEAGLPINFHIATGDNGLLEYNGHPDNGKHANYASMGVSFFMGNARTIAQLICGGVCHRFPTLDFVSVESGIGWIPFALAALDWQWKNCGVHLEHPEYELLPSEFFQRQIYGCFWFEDTTAKAALDILGPDNILYETDFPHPTSMSPGPASGAVRPDDYLEQTFADTSEDVLRKILHDNAARIYHLD
jgi:predicted TIM-barrel fold metal-dependent hydrolase